jgi:fatty acid desaturase
MRQVKAAGLLERRRGYYWVRIAVTGGLFAAGWAGFVVLGDSWWQLVVAAFLAVVFIQIGFIGHDAGHRQIFRTRRANDLAGLAHGNLAVGLSFGGWVYKHGRHHAHPNTEGKDPDIDIGAVAFTAGQAVAKQGRITRFIAAHQRYLFVPLLLEAVQLHVSGVQAVTGRGLRHRGWEALLLGLHAAGFLAVVLLVLSPVKAVVFVVVQQALFGLYLGCSFAPTTRACRLSPPMTRPTSCVGRFSPPATCAAAGWSTSPSAG